MTITTQEGYFNAPKETIGFEKTATRTTVAGGWFSTFDLAGSPGAGTLAVGNTANGIVPTDAIAGYPLIGAFGASALGYLGRGLFVPDLNSGCRVFDCVFASGAHAFNANQALTSQPSFASRLPGGSYAGLEIWVEQVLAATGNQAVSVTYTNPAGQTGRVTGAVGIAAAPTVGRCWRLPLQAGDSSVQQITNIQGSVASAGTFNVRLLRPLWTTYALAMAKDAEDWSRRPKPAYADMALYVLVRTPTGTTISRPYIELDIANG